MVFQFYFLDSFSFPSLENRCFFFKRKFLLLIFLDDLAFANFDFTSLHDTFLLYCTMELLIIQLYEFINNILLSLFCSYFRETVQKSSGCRLIFYNKTLTN